jgi:hypothetical protein
VLSRHYRPSAPATVTALPPALKLRRGMAHDSNASGSVRLLPDDSRDACIAHHLSPNDNIRDADHNACRIGCMPTLEPAVLLIIIDSEASDTFVPALDSFRAGLSWYGTRLQR